MRYIQTIIFLLIIGGVVYDFTNDAERDESGSIVAEGEIDAFAMNVGDCFNDPQQMDEDGSAVEVEGVAGLPCSEPHDNEVYAVFDVSLATFPGEAAMFDVATEECLDRFDSFVGRAYQDSVLDIFTLYPNQYSWSQVNDREVVCAVYHIEGEKLKGSSRGSSI